MAEDKAMVCPFCGWTNEAGEYEMLLVRLLANACGQSRGIMSC
jgi:hypothetical protein